MISDRETRWNELTGSQVRDQPLYYPAAREPSEGQPRLTQLVQNGRRANDIGLPPIDRAADQFMLCRSAAMLRDLRAVLDDRKFVEGSHAEAGDCVHEKAFVGWIIDWTGHAGVAEQAGATRFNPRV